LLSIKRSETVSFYSHLTGLIAAILGLLFLIIKTKNTPDLILVSLVYSISMCSMFAFSALYHATKNQDNATGIWRKLDHIAIFFMIAGSYSPLCYIYLTGAWRWSIIITVWSFVVCGILLKVFFIKAPRIFSTVLYLLMGWLALIPIVELIHIMPRFDFSLLLGGGASYSLGAIFYAIKKPNPLPGVFGFHEIFHLLIMVGAALHFIVIYLAVKPI